MKTNVRTMTRIALMTAAICVITQFSIPIGAVPMTFQTLLIVFAGAFLGPKDGVASVMLYLLLGAAGLPVFSNMTGGIGALLGPTGGFLAAFPVLAALSGMNKHGKFVSRLAASLLGLAFLYFVGAARLASIAGMGFEGALAVGVFPFVLKDVISACGGIYFAGVIGKRLSALIVSSTP